jgi:hypothetical protein
LYVNCWFGKYSTPLILLVELPLILLGLLAVMLPVGHCQRATVLVNRHARPFAGGGRSSVVRPLGAASSERRVDELSLW